MYKQNHKSTLKFDTAHELQLMCYSIRAIRDRVNADLDAMVDRISRLLPPEDSALQRRMKKYSKEDWKNYLKF